ncbi:MAG: hypothetical protein ABJB49_08110 [Nitrospirota bacterium]
MKTKPVLLAFLMFLAACAAPPIAKEDRPPPGCAHLRSGARCGLGGVEVYVVNDRTSQSVRATVRENWHQGASQGHNDHVYSLSAGGEAFVGCTRSSYTPVVQSTYEVIGCESAKRTR